MDRWELPTPLATAKARMGDGTVITLRRHGNPVGPRMVLSHGNGLAADLYYLFWSRLADRFDIVVHDLRSHGWNAVSSLRTHNIPTLIRDTGDISAAIDAHFGAKPKVGVFHSLALVGKDQYKPTERGDVQAVARGVRDRIVQKLSDGSLFARYRLRVDLSENLDQVCIDDAEGDSLDAVLAAVQAAWSWVRRDGSYGVPQDCDLVEGWIVDPVTQPSVNSSITRVRPVFRQLLGKNPTGASWLSQVLQLSKSSGLSRTTRSEPGTVLPAVSEKRRYADPVQGNIELERCFEFSVAPGRSFLRWLLENPDRMTWPVSAGHRVSYSATTQARREALLGFKGDSARKAAQASALRALDRNGPKKSARQWWSFEGFTEVDCCLETDKLVLLIAREANREPF